MASDKKLVVGAYRVACITVISEEAAAFQQIIDSIHKRPDGIVSQDRNQYTFGEIAGHNVVVCCAFFPGPENAAAAATHLKRSFPNINFALLVGIDGGVPSTVRDIRLGDVVVCASEGFSGGIAHHDRGKQLEDGFMPLVFPTVPPPILQGAACQMQIINSLGNSIIPDIISSVVRKHSQFERPSPQSDLFFHSDYHHVPGNPTCNKCDRARIVPRSARADLNPHFHYGLIASGGQVIKSATKRESLRASYNVCCIEMEAAGLQVATPCLIIRGISDYADSHKNDHWKNHAALSAAAYAKELLTCIAPPENDFELDSGSGRDRLDTGQSQTRSSVLDWLEREVACSDAKDWRQSISDPLKLLGLDWDLRARARLAELLQVHEGRNGTAKQNIALHRALMRTLRVRDNKIAIPHQLEELRR